MRKEGSNWPRPSRRPSKPPRATFDVPAANSHLQRQPRSYLGSFPLSRTIDRRNHGGRNQRLLHRRGRHCRLHPRGSRVDGRMTLLSSNPLWPAAAAAPPSHRPPAPPLLPPLPQFPQTLTLDDAIAENCTCEIFSVLLVKPHIYLDVYIATNSKIVSG